MVNWVYISIGIIVAIFIFLIYLVKRAGKDDVDIANEIEYPNKVMTPRNSI